MDEVFQSSQPRLGFHQQTLIIYAVVLFLPLSPKSGGKPQTHCPVLCLRVKSLSSPPLGTQFLGSTGCPFLIGFIAKRMIMEFYYEIINIILYNVHMALINPPAIKYANSRFTIIKPPRNKVRQLFFPVFSVFSL